MENPFEKYHQIANKVNSIYHSFQNSKLVKNNWIITDEAFYNTYKNKINITHINYFKDTIGHYYEDYLVYDYRFSFETIKRYGAFKYNTNFIAGIIGDTEYEVSGDLQLIAVNSQIMDNYEKNKTEPPEFEEVLNILGWKIKEKPLLYIKDELKYK